PSGASDPALRAAAADFPRAVCRCAPEIPSFGVTGRGDGSMARPTPFRCTRAATKAPQRGLCQMALSAEAQELRDRIIDEYDFSPAELAVLSEGLEAWDTAVEAQKAVEEHGVVIRDRFGQIVRNPAVGIAKDAR